MWRPLATRRTGLRGRHVVKAAQRPVAANATADHARGSLRNEFHLRLRFQCAVRRLFQRPWEQAEACATRLGALPGCHGIRKAPLPLKSENCTE